MRIYGVTTRQRARLPNGAHIQPCAPLDLYKLLHIDFLRNHKQQTTAFGFPSCINNTPNIDRVL